MNNNKAKNEIDKNVQRLGSDLSSEINFPRVLRDLRIHDENILNFRKEMILTGEANTNSNKLKEYKTKVLPQQLDRRRFDWALGLALGDATIQSNGDCQMFRLKMQQSKYNFSLIQVTREILLPYTLQDTYEVKKRKIQNEYVSYSTIEAPAFKDLALLLKDPTQELTSNCCVRKVITPQLKEYLTPITLGSWFSTDGGRRDYGVNQGKAIQFHTQGFDVESVDLLAQMLRELYGWDVRSKLDYTNAKGKAMHLLQIEANSFEAFCTKIQPYIIDHFQKRLPEPRSPRSKRKI